jgi:hypothetical protein
MGKGPGKGAPARAAAAARPTGDVVLALAGGALVLGFFLPWLDLGPFSASGLDYAQHGAALHQLRGGGDGGWFRHAVWLFPLTGAALLVTGLWLPRLGRGLALVAGLATIAWIAVVTGKTLVLALSWGGWVELACAAALVVAGLTGTRALAGAAGGIAAIGFLFPWYQDTSGYDIARIAARGLHLRVGELAYLAVAGGVLGLVASSGRPLRRGLALIAGALVAIATLTLYAAVADVVLGLGAWLTIIGATAALLIGLVAVRRRGEARRAARRVR